MHTKIKFFSFILLLICFALSSNCNASENINYRLKWLFNTSVIGDLYAYDTGLFKKTGLDDVKVKAGGPERDAIRELELGYAQFGVASADQVIRATAKGSHVVVIAQLFQVNPLQWIYKSDKKSITCLKDLKGKKIGITYGGNDETIMRAILTKANIKENEVKLFSVRYDYTPFYMDKVDVWPVYRNAQGIILEDKLKKSKENVNFFIPSDYGIQFVANSIVTSKKMIQQHPEIVNQFKSALLQGWRLALDPANEEKALLVLSKYDPDTPLYIQKKQLAVTRELIQPDKSINIGYINIKAWQQTEKIMLDQNLISKPIFVEKLLTKHQ